MESKTEILVFDLYNTLIEFQQYRNFLGLLYKKSDNGFGIDKKEYRELVMKSPIENIFNSVSNDFKDSFIEHEDILRTEIDSIIIYPDTIPALTELQKKYDLYLISNLASPYVDPFIQLGLKKFFKKSIFSCEVGFTKPSKEIFKIIEEVTNKCGEQIMMIGDSLQSDIGGAKNMGWRYAHINRKSELTNNLQIGSLTELENKITS